jgi:hypothetical protein
MLGLFLFLMQSSMAVPAYSPPANRPHYDPAVLSIVVADTVRQTDPRPLCARPGCTAMFLGTFRDARTLAGVSPGTAFAARIEMGSPFEQSYRLAMVIARQPNGDIEVLSTHGFHYQTHLACFDRKDTDALGWHPEGPGLSHDHGQICVSEG